MKTIRGKVCNFGKRILRKIPGFKGFFRKMDLYGKTIEQQGNTINQLSNEMQHITDRFRDVTSEIWSELSKQTVQFEREVAMLNVALEKNAMKNVQMKRRAIAHRFTIKRMAGIPVKVVFLIEEPSVIKNTLSLIEELSSDKRFEVVLVNLWYKVYKDEAYTYKRPNIESVIDVSKYTVVESYDRDTEQWLLLESLLPDYVFFLRPYDFYRNTTYHIEEVSEYARTCYVPYGIQTIGGDVEKMVLTPECTNLYYFFMDNAVRKDFISEAMRGTCFEKEGKLIYLGYPGMDMLSSHDEIKRVDNKWFTILWLPRWNNTENNCHFFEYKDVLVDYAKQYSDSRIVLRPHPLCFNNFINTGEMTEDELIQLRKDYSEPNAIDETSNYIDAFCMSSVLVADETSLIAEYFLTEKPIIFCKKETHFSLLMEKLIEGCYVANSKQELINILEDLRKGNDTLKEKRKEIAELTLLDYGVSAACNIKEELWKDFTCEYKFN